MAQFNFADRYAEAGLAPTAEIISSRTAAATRVIESLTKPQVIALVGGYYGVPGTDLDWVRDQFRQDDPTFTLVSNAREVRILSAILLAQRVADEDAVAALAVVVSHAAGHRSPTEASWLLNEAHQALTTIAAAEREPVSLETKVTWTATQKLGDEIAGLPAGDWPALVALLGKMRTEYQNSMRTMSSQATAALGTLDRQVRMQHEETEILWWLFGGHSRCLDRPFAALEAFHAAMAGALDLATLTTVSEAGPIATEAMLERIISSGKKAKGSVKRSLSEIVDSVGRDDLLLLPVTPTKLPAALAPVTTAIDQARTIGVNAWQGRFGELTHLTATVELDTSDLAQQLYREHLLGQLL